MFETIILKIMSKMLFSRIHRSAMDKILFFCCYKISVWFSGKEKNNYWKILCRYWLVCKGKKKNWEQYSQNVLFGQYKYNQIKNITDFHTLVRSYCTLQQLPFYTANKALPLIKCIFLSHKIYTFHWRILHHTPLWDKKHFTNNAQQSPSSLNPDKILHWSEKHCNILL